MPPFHTSVLALLGVALFAASTPAARAGSYTLLHTFKGGLDGANPLGRLIRVGARLYGTTSQGGDNTNLGTVFSIDPKSGAETVRYSFTGMSIAGDGSDGANPYGGLLDVDGVLYGTTYFGGIGTDYGCGTVFSFNPKTNAETVVLAFPAGTGGCLPSAGLLNVDGTLYSTTWDGNPGYGLGNGTVFSVNPHTGAETILHYFNVDADHTLDGENPQGDLLYVNGTLYGTTTYGGATICPGEQDCGTVFSVDPATDAETVLHSFKGGSDGAFPAAGLIKVGKLLFGTTAQGGSTNCSSAYGSGCGTVFSVNPSTGVEKVEYTFTGGADGAFPTDDLIDVGGTLYGVAQAGGAYNEGVVFSLNPKTGAQTVVYSFKGGADGAHPSAGLIDAGGTLYGTTMDGGGAGCADGCGTVFEYAP